MRLRRWVSCRWLWFGAALILGSGVVEAHADKNKQHTAVATAQAVYVHGALPQLIDKSRPGAKLRDSRTAVVKGYSFNQFNVSNFYSYILSGGKPNDRLFSKFHQILVAQLLPRFGSFPLIKEIPDDFETAKDFAKSLDDFLRQINFYNDSKFRDLFRSIPLSKDTQDLLQENSTPEGDDLFILNLLLLRDYYNNLGEQIFVPDEAAIQTALRDDAPPEELFYLDADIVYWHQKNNPGDAVVYAPSINYSDSPRGFDLGFQPLFGTFQGLGIRFSLDLGPDSRRYARRLSAYWEAIEKKDFEEEPALYEDLRNAYTRTVLGWNVAAVFDYNNVNQIGNVKSAGINLSRVFWHDNGQSALSALVSAQGVQFNPEGQSVQYAVRTSAALVWQDKIAFFGAPNEAIVQRWRWQVGFENDFKNVVDGGNSWNAFVRYRPGKYNDITLTYGKWPDHSDYIGIGTSWSLR